MKLTKLFGVVAVAAMALMAFASSASATTLEIKGVAQTTDVTLEATLEESALLTDTAKSFANTCTSSTVKGSDSTKTLGTVVEGPVSTLSFSGCTHEKVVVNNPGTLSVERIGVTTNGTVRSSGANLTVPGTIGGSLVSLTCTTNNTDIGTLTGVKEGSATMDINGVINCGFFLPSAKWEGKYKVTSPANLGVTS
jgi:hypothetical protein